MPASNQTLLRVARPTFVVDGQDQPGLAEGLLQLAVTEDTQGLSRCEAAFGNWGALNRRIGFLYFGRDLLEFGKTFAVKCGADTIFDGRIGALEADFPEGAPPRVTVLAEDRLQDLRMTRRTRTFADQSDADVVRAIAGEHGLTPQIDLSGPTHKILAQVNQSDLAFLRDRCRSLEAEIWVDGSTLHAKSRADRSGEPLELSFGRDLFAFKVLADLAHQRTTVTASGWDVSGKSAFTHSAGSSLVQGELDGGDGGAQILEQAFGARKEALVHTLPLSAQETEAVAGAYFKMTARRFVVGHGRAEGRADLRVGRTVDLSGLGPLFSGKYYLASVRHLFDGKSGYRVEFTAERAALGRPN
ncbi:MAG TPA: contractile injection system protein, VgrG/Pvc8 family [Lacunisphaera sp.]|nr:contractile injection system protein, VgrG/Pvc8 family [Lacunisphaera sp.]